MMRSRGCVDVALYLINHGCTCSDEDKAELLCERMCLWGKVDVVKELVEQHKVDPNSECWYMFTLQINP